MDFIYFEESWNVEKDSNMSSKFFGNRLTPNTKQGSSKIKKSKGNGNVKQVIKKAGRGK